MAGVCILTDSTCDLSSDIIEKYEIGVLPLYVTMGEKVYRDGVDIASKELCDWAQKTKQVPKTSAPSPMDAHEFLEKWIDSKKNLVFIGISDKLSATCQVVRLAAQNFPEADIRVIDSQSLSTGIGLLVLKAARLAKQGLSADEIEREILNLVPRVRASFVIDTTLFLYRGGRCSAVESFCAGLLQIKPQIVVKDGALHPSRRFRGNIVKSVLNYVESMSEDLVRADREVAFVTHSPYSDAIVPPVMEYLKSLGHFDEIIETEAGAVITSHCGPGTLGVLYIGQEA